jgi:C-terminal peptidase prc
VASATPKPAPTQAPPTPFSLTEVVATQGLPAHAKARHYALFTEIWELVRDRYAYADYRGLDWAAIGEEYGAKVTLVTSDEEFYALMQEMIDLLGDEHSAFLSPEQVAWADAVNQSLQIPGGIGALVHEIDGEPTLLQVFPGNPGYEAGLRPGERILAVDGVTWAQFSGVWELILAITGEAGTEVLLTVRSLDGSEREVTVTRATVNLKDTTVQARMIEGSQVGLLTLSAFDLEQVPDQVRGALVELAGDNTLEGLIVDIRANPGGLHEAMLATLALFVDGGSIGTRMGREVVLEVMIPEGQTMPEVQALPLVVLTGRQTQSAAECFAVGLQLFDRATIVGLPTAGNTETLPYRRLAGGAEVAIAEWAYYLPDGTSIEGIGLQPDLVVEGFWWVEDPGEDPQIQAAIEVLRSQ